MPGRVGTIMGREGGLIMGGPGIMGMWPPMGGRIPGAAGEGTLEPSRCSSLYLDQTRPEKPSDPSQSQHSSSETSQFAFAALRKLSTVHCF